MGAHTELHPESVRARKRRRNAGKVLQRRKKSVEALDARTKRLIREAKKLKKLRKTQLQNDTTAANLKRRKMRRVRGA